MIRRALVRVLVLPWPPPLRGVLEKLAMANLVQRVFVPHFKIGVVGVIRNSSGEVLLFRHTYRHEYPWGLPSGFMEPGEQPDAALRREIAEEVGIDVALQDLWKAYTDTGRSLLNIVFRGASVGGVLRPRGEISAAGYYPLDRLPRLIPDQAALLEAIRKEDRAEATGSRTQLF